VKVLEHLKTDCLKWSGKGEDCYLEALTYPGERLALQIVGYWRDEDECEQEEPLATATVNLPADPCPPGEVYVKDYSENEGMVQQLIQWGVIEPKIMFTAASGFVKISRFQLTKKFLERLAEAGFSHLK
jgi:hypothetical protein